MADLHSKQLSVFIDMFLQYRKTTGQNPKSLFFEGWYYLEDERGAILSLNGIVHFPQIYKETENEYSDTFFWAIEEKTEVGNMAKPEKEKPKANTLEVRTFEEHLKIKQNAATKK